MTENPLEQWLRLRDISRDALMSHYGMANNAISENATYGHIQGLTMVNDPAKLPGRVYYQGARFTLLTIPETNLTRDAITAVYGDAEENLASRAGKLYRHYVYPKAGFAFSSTRKENDVTLLEIFQPCLLEEYERNFYIPVDDYIK